MQNESGESDISPYSDEYPLKTTKDHKDQPINHKPDPSLYAMPVSRSICEKHSKDARSLPLGACNLQHNCTSSYQYQLVISSYLKHMLVNKTQVNSQTRPEISPCLAGAESTNSTQPQPNLSGGAAKGKVPCVSFKGRQAACPIGWFLAGN